MIRTSGFTPANIEPVPSIAADNKIEEVPRLKEKKQEASRSVQPVKTAQQISVKRSRATRTFYWMLVLFLLGMLYGASFLQSGQDGLWDSLSAVNQSYLYAAQSQANWMIFLNALTSSAVFLLISFVSGLSAVGQPVSLGLLFIRGLGFGSYTGYLYLTQGMQGVLYAVLMILPGMLLSVIALTLSCREAFRLSNRILFSFLRDSVTLKREMLTLYLKKHVILFAMLAASAGIECVLRFVFSGMFHLE